MADISSEKYIRSSIQDQSGKILTAFMDKAALLPDNGKKQLQIVFPLTNKDAMTLKRNR
jgi:hypothetical protein